jgi:hypothetical protein
MTRGRSRKRHCTSRKSTDENDHSQTRQGEEIATPPAQCTSLRRGRPEEFAEMNPSNSLQTEPDMGNDFYYAASVVSLNAHNWVPRVPLFTIDHIGSPLPTAAQTLEDHYCEESESQQLFLNCLTPVWHMDICLFARQSEEYSNKAHLSAVKAEIQYPKTLLQNQDDEVPDYEPSDDDDEYSCLQNPTKTPIISKEFFRKLPLCPIIHWVSQMSNNPKLCFCPCSMHSRPWKENTKIFIHDDHECKIGAMTSQELLRHLKNEGDSTHTAISMYLETLNTFS